MIRFALLVFAFLTVTQIPIPQQNPDSLYPQDYFRSPVDYAIKLSGTFGELRPNHFHAGIDIKAKSGKTGQNIYAAADGTVSRINIKSSGYGNALYINHPNGYTSVYAHLQKFPKEITDYMHTQQYLDQNSETEHYPTAGKFNFKKGDIIGTLGVSGRSYGPHLHFEIRETQSEIPINPLLFGLKIEDKVRPDLRMIKLYALDSNMNELGMSRYTLRKNGASFIPSKDTMNINASQVGLALKAYDQMSGVPNLNGIYALQMYVNDSLHFSFNMDKISFDETRYINAHLDYEEQVNNKRYFNRCFRMPGNKLSIYQSNKYNGVIQINEDKATKIKYVVIDLNGNKSKCQFWIKKSKDKAVLEGEAYQYYLFHDKENQIDRAEIKLFFPHSSLYRNLELKYLSSLDSSYNIYSRVFHVHDHLTPLHKYFDISIKPDKDLKGQEEKAFIGYCGKDQRYVNNGGKWEGAYLKTKAGKLGNFCIMVDTVPPSIEPIRFSKSLKGYKSITFKITDNFETGKGVAGLVYNAYVDDQWILMKYNGKKETITYKFDELLTPGTHRFKLVVTDALNNTTQFIKEITL